ncbi:hypothetical protein V6R21_21730 [Limibacter armeniacum]|uniref:hypothetical protein n=1 Tax=Limibacter armeniacum TaxID=466084 RepID=UPI002FE53DA6
MIIFRNSSCVTEWLPEKNALINRWKGVVREEEFVGTMKACMWFAAENPVKHYVSDRTDLEYLWDGWEDWSVKNLANNPRSSKTVDFILIDPNRNFAPFLQEDFEMRFRENGSELRVKIAHDNEELKDILSKKKSKSSV